MSSRLYGPHILPIVRRAAPLEYGAYRAAAASTVQAAGLLHDVLATRDVHREHLRILRQQLKTAQEAETMSLQAMAGALERRVDSVLGGGHHV